MPAMFSVAHIAALSLFALGSVAIPTPEALEKRWEQCLSRADAQQVATNYANLIAHYTDQLANAALTDGFSDYSEGVNTLINSCPQGAAAIARPLVSPSFTDRVGFEKAQAEQAPINFQQLQLWHGCDSVTIRWETTNTANLTDTKPVVGIIVIETVPAPSGSPFSHLISTVYSEFDAAAWLQNLQEAGVCNSSTVASPSNPSLTPTTTFAPPTSTSWATGAPLETDSDCDEEETTTAWATRPTPPA